MQKKLKTRFYEFFLDLKSYIPEAVPKNLNSAMCYRNTLGDCVLLFGWITENKLFDSLFGDRNLKMKLVSAILTFHLQFQYYV